MTTQEIKEYYDATEQRETREDLVYAASIVSGEKIAIDCGCGAGSDIGYLSELGFKVYAFDSEEESVLRCKKRFEDNNNIQLFKDSFDSFDYPKTSLIVADASLFFCAESKFDSVWSEMYKSLFPDGVFCGSFLGPEDTMAGQGYDRQKFWPNVLVCNEEQVRERFVNYHILRFTEHKMSGSTPQCDAHDWHIYSVVARKNK